MLIRKLIFALLGFVLLSAGAAYASLLRVCFIDVGQGDAVFIRYPDEKTMLVDSGDFGKGAVVNAFLEKEKVTVLDYFVWSHPHADHLGGAGEVLENYDVKTVYDSGSESSSAFYEEILEHIEKNEGIKYSFARRGEAFKIGGVEVKFLNPPKELYSGTESDLNENSIVMKLKYGNVSFLLTGDSGEPAEEDIVDIYGAELESQVLKVGHHGSRHSSSLDFIAKVKPQYAVIQVGRRNSYKHPTMATLLTLEKYSDEILRTDMSGNIIIETDGKEITVKTEKSGNIETGRARRTSRKSAASESRKGYKKNKSRNEEFDVQ